MWCEMCVFMQYMFNIHNLIYYNYTLRHLICKSPNECLFQHVASLYWPSVWINTTGKNVYPLLPSGWHWTVFLCLWIGGGSIIYLGGLHMSNLRWYNSITPHTAVMYARRHIFDDVLIHIYSVLMSGINVTSTVQHSWRVIFIFQTNTETLLHKPPLPMLFSPTVL